MNAADLFVGAVSAIAGGLGVAAGVANWEQCYQSTKARWVVNRVGRFRARLIYIGGGIFFIALGIAIARGFALAGSKEQGARSGGPGAWSWEQGAGSWERGAEGGERRAMSEARR